MTVSMTAVVPIDPEPPTAVEDDPPSPQDAPKPLANHQSSTTNGVAASYDSETSRKSEHSSKETPLKSRGDTSGNFSQRLSLRSDFTDSPLIVEHRSSLTQRFDKPPPTRIQRMDLELARWLTPVVDNCVFRAMQMVALAVALFGGGFWTVANFADDPGNAVRDAIMTLVTCWFIFEIVMTWLVEKDYRCSAFFWMDVLGSVSMIFEISYLLGTAGKRTENNEGMDTVLLRSARAAKLGARAGRLTKLVRCWQFIFRRGGNDYEEKGRGVEAKVMSKTLMVILAAKISLLSVVLVLVAPMLQIPVYPEADWSMRAWATRLEADYSRAYLLLANCQQPSCESSEIVGIFRKTVEEMQAFYDDLNYHPYKLTGFSPRVTINGKTVSIPGAELLHGHEPNQQESVIAQSVSKCVVDREECSGEVKAAIYFDMGGPKRVEAVMDMLTIVFMVGVMAVCACDLSRTLDNVVVHPLERMNAVLRKHLSKIFSEVAAMQGVDEQVEDEGEGKTEMELVELVLGKIARLTAIMTAKHVLDHTEMAELDREGKGVIVDMLRLDPGRRRSTCANTLDTTALALSELVVQSLPFPAEEIEDWGLDLLSVDSEALFKVVMYLFFDSKLGRGTGRAFTNVATFQNFHDVVQEGYNQQPYHNYAHACDVVHSVYHYMYATSAEIWINNVEQYALLVAALCHDVGHQGRTNPFLVETKHALALRYNDRSPLENMHCATLFEICADEEADVFNTLPANKYRKARKVCVDAILHTDNAGHFDMVKDIKRIYEMASPICDAQSQQEDKEDLLPDFIEEVLRKEGGFWLEVFLHLADVSNPLTPFEVCKAWAWRVLDEFFDQGDEEKRLGIPVGMLNDREKVNKPGSQHGFINFLVAPLVFACVSVFGELHPMSQRMAENLQSWRNLWVEEAHPSKEDIDKKDADVKKIADEVQRLLDRGEIEDD